MRRTGEEQAVAFRVGRGRALYVTAGAVAAVAAVLAGIVTATSSGGGGSAPVRLSAAPLGLDVAPWDYATRRALRPAAA